MLEASPDAYPVSIPEPGDSDPYGGGGTDSLAVEGPPEKPPNPPNELVEGVLEAAGCDVFVCWEV